jgi:predicted RNase H-like nuclease (RuvC/YqgF family)
MPKDVVKELVEYMEHGDYRFTKEGLKRTINDQGKTIKNLLEQCDKLKDEIDYLELEVDRLKTRRRSEKIPCKRACGIHGTWFGP